VTNYKLLRKDSAVWSQLKLYLFTAREKREETLPLKNISEIINNLELCTQLDNNGLHLIAFIENANGSYRNMV
jgi:hypothetical protein